MVYAYNIIHHFNFTITISSVMAYEWEYKLYSMFCVRWFGHY